MRDLRRALSSWCWPLCLPLIAATAWSNPVEETRAALTKAATNIAEATVHAQIKAIDTKRCQSFSSLCVAKPLRKFRMRMPGGAIRRNPSDGITSLARGPPLT
jgi:hypothetical protein